MPNYTTKRVLCNILAPDHKGDIGNHYEAPDKSKSYIYLINQGSHFAINNLSKCFHVLRCANRRQPLFAPPARSLTQSLPLDTYRLSPGYSGISPLLAVFSSAPLSGQGWSSGNIALA